MWPDRAFDRISRACNTQSGTVIATPVRPPTRTEAQADYTVRSGGRISAFKLCNKANWDIWKADISSRTLTPTVDQWSVIASMHERLVREGIEASKSSQQKSKHEPLRSMIQGLAGASKTMVTTLLVEYFESVLG